ncbi:chemotaxis protein MotB [Micromonospora pattaloongensis]|uniref:Chemotaxis protein MotB n=1 Tax=Micromonospora pattaloongensis TaxID=405436 RepID=A0A1H3MZM1_9ACTN|nr:flagellar motor protein MotB [Micromonospora pattaloongensis]SDY81419.1 chemotaxis protein MotB [Micromonospora pattaloongensis]
MSHKKRGGHHEEEEHVNHERWLVSYADMLTLLFVLFVVLFSMSNVDKAKFEKLASSLADGFGSRSAAFSGQSAPLEGSGNDSNVFPIDPGANPGLEQAVSRGVPPTAEQRAREAGAAAAERARASANARAAAREAKNLKEIEKEIRNALVRAGLQESVQFTIDERGLHVTVVTSEVVFAGDRADLLTAGRKIMDAVAPPLLPLSNTIQVDGHTNQLPAPTINYPSAWELSTARASTVVRYLNAKGVPQKRLAAAGYAGTRPLIPPDDPRSVTMNRRVDIVIMSSLPPEQSALLPSAAN